MMDIRLIEVPYDSGVYNERMGKGPFAFVKGGVVDRLLKYTKNVEEVVVNSDASFLMENSASFELIRKVSEQVNMAIKNGQFPLVLSGNCNITVGVLSGLNYDVGLIWFDAHGDSNTPETTETGFLDGMGVSMVRGLCWQNILSLTPGYKPLSNDRIFMIGAHDVDDIEARELDNSGIKRISWKDIRNSGVQKALENSLNKLSIRISSVHIHLDMDVHDSKLAPANHFKPKGGLSPKEVRECIRVVASKFKISSAVISAYSPEADVEQKGLGAALEAIDLIGNVA